VILILAPRKDVHAVSVRQHLLARGAPVRLVDFGDRSCVSGVSMRCESDGAGATIRFTDGTSLEVASIGCIWLRRPRLPDLSGELPASRDREFAAAEWAALLDGLAGATDAVLINDPRAQENCSKPRQLRSAAAVGLAVPRTLITSVPSEARSFLDSLEGRAIHKPMTAPRDCFPATKRWNEGDGTYLGQLSTAPTIFQEEITGQLDLRITVIGERMFAVGFPPSSFEDSDGVWVDSRLNLEVPFTPYDLPPEVQKAVGSLMYELGLCVGTIDMKVDDSGRHVFLEVNPQGQFLYIEILTGLPLGQAMADFLATVAAGL
jgi:hypothetical protein